MTFLGTIVPLASFYRVVFHRLYGALNIDQVTNGCSKLTQRTGSLFLNPNPNPPKDGVVGGLLKKHKRVRLCFWDNGFETETRSQKRSTR